MTSSLPYPHSFEHGMNPQTPLSQTAAFSFTLRGQTLSRFHSRRSDVRSSPSHDGEGFSLRLACTPDLIRSSLWHLNHISGNLHTLVATRDGARTQTWICQSMVSLQTATRQRAWGWEVMRVEEPRTNKRCVLTLIPTNEACTEPVL